MFFQFHELFSVIFWHKFCSLCMYHYDPKIAPTKELIAISIKEVDTHNKLFQSFFITSLDSKATECWDLKKSPNNF